MSADIPPIPLTEPFSGEASVRSGDWRWSVALSKQTKQEFIQKFAKSPSDTGSTEVQIALLAARVNQLTEHLQTHRKDFHTRRGLHVIVGQRRRLLLYLRRTDPRRYQQIIRELNIRGV